MQLMLNKYLLNEWLNAILIPSNWSNKLQLLRKYQFLIGLFVMHWFKCLCVYIVSICWCFSIVDKNGTNASLCTLNISWSFFIKFCLSVMQYFSVEIFLTFFHLAWEKFHCKFWYTLTFFIKGFKTISGQVQIMIGSNKSKSLHISSKISKTHKKNK